MEEFVTQKMHGGFRQDRDKESGEKRIHLTGDNRCARVLGKPYHGLCKPCGLVWCECLCAHTRVHVCEI